MLFRSQDRGLRDHLLAKRMTPRKIKPMPNSAPDVTYPRPKHSLLTACIQLSTENERVSTFEARVNQAPFKQMVESHLICGIALTPATVFAELALEAAAYLHDANDDGNDSSSPAQFEVRNLSMFSSLFLEPSNPSQVVRVSAQGVATDPNGAYIQFFSYDLATGASHQHGSCTVLASDPNNVERDWLKMQHLIKGRIQTLQADADNIIRKDMAYSLFETIVAYSNGYQGMQTVFMGPAGDEAVSEVMLNPAAVKGEFLCSPFLLDSCGQL